jgi:retron-type reverse transcriptase
MKVPSDWVIDFEIKAFFDSLSNDLVERAVAHHTDNLWVRLYISRRVHCAPIAHQSSTIDRLPIA